MVLNGRGVVLAWVVVLSVVAAGVGAAQATLPADVKVVETECSDGRIYALTADVTLRSDDAVTVTAHVWSEGSHVQLAWAPTRTTVEPGAQTIRFRAPRQRAAIAGEKAQIALHAGQRRAITNFETGGCT